MYEHVTFASVLRRMLDRVLAQAPNLDTREGSILYNALAPAAVELQNLYIQLDAVLDQTFADTAAGAYLERRAAERGLTPYPATRAVLRGAFNMDIPIGSRFSLDDLNYTAVEKMSAGVYRMECETEGEAGNANLGTLVPIQYLNGLTDARLTELLVPGEDREGTESLRKRYFSSLSAQAFGGNVADYLEKVGAMDGVGGVKVYREWNGDFRPAELVPPAGVDAWKAGLADTPAEIKRWLDRVSTAAADGRLTVGGAVRLVLIDSTWAAPSAELIAQVQQRVDPETDHAEGVGLAPIGHFVTVRGVEARPIDISTTLTYQEGWSWEAVKPHADRAVDGYLLELAKAWADQPEALVVRLSIIETNLLACPGVLDVGGTTVNGLAQNLVLGADQIPVRGELHG